MGIYTRGRPLKYDAFNRTGSEPPGVVGEYRIRYKSNMLKYIGITNNLHHRMEQHIRSGKINEDAPFFEWKAAIDGTTYKQLREHERQKIKLHKPEGNMRGGGGGREPTSMRYIEQQPREYNVPLEQMSHGIQLYGIDGGKKKTAVLQFAVSRVLKTILIVVIAIVLIATILYYAKPELLHKVIQIAIDHID